MRKKVNPACHPDRKHCGNGMCRPCYRATPEHRAYQAAHWAARYATPEGKADYLASQRARFATSKGRAKRAISHSLQAARKYGHTPILWTWQRLASWLETKGDTCDACGKACPSGRRLSVDHDHKTGEVRALLCHPCNVDMGALDRFAEDPALLRRLVKLSGHVGSMRKCHCVAY